MSTVLLFLFKEVAMQACCIMTNNSFLGNVTKFAAIIMTKLKYVSLK